VVNKCSLGGYDVFSGDVFCKLGNISDDFGVAYKEDSGSEASIDFTSEGASSVKFVGDTKVDVINAGDVKARVEIEFSQEKYFLVKSPMVTVTTIDNVNVVAKALMDSEKWDGQWKVVYQVYNAIDPRNRIDDKRQDKAEFQLRRLRPWTDETWQR
jgi:hypothetical protein